MVNKERLLKKINRLKQQISELKQKHGDKPTEKYTYHGGWDLGYYEGKLSAYEDLYDDIFDDIYKDETLEVAYEKMFGIPYNQKIFYEKDNGVKHDSKL